MKRVSASSLGKQKAITGYSLRVVVVVGCRASGSGRVAVGVGMQEGGSPFRPGFR